MSIETLLTSIMIKSSLSFILKSRITSVKNFYEYVKSYNKPKLTREEYKNTYESWVRYVRFIVININDFHKHEKFILLSENFTKSYDVLSSFGCEDAKNVFNSLNNIISGVMAYNMSYEQGENWNPPVHPISELNSFIEGGIENKIYQALQKYRPISETCVCQRDAK